MINLPYLGTVYLENPYLLLIIFPLIIVYFFIIRKRFVNIEFKKNLLLNRFMLLLSRTIITLMLIFALCSPFNLIEDTQEIDPRITILLDNSSSMDIFDLSFVNEISEKLNEKVPTNIRIIGNENSSRISEGIFTNIDSRNLILITDGQNYEGRDLSSTLMLARSENVTIWAVDLEPIAEDYSITIEGPSKVVKDVENEYIIKINNNENENYVNVNLKINGITEFEKSTNQDEIIFRKTFNEGQHRITAEILNEDKIKANNIFHKSIEVIDKPEILFLTEKTSPLLNILEQLYNVDTYNRLPNNLDNYLTIIINDFDKLNNQEINKLSNYANEGNGLIFIGGENSFDQGNYIGTGIEKILPINFEKIDKEEPVQDVYVVLLLDKSGSTAFELRDDMPGVNVVQGIAIDLINSMDRSTHVGAIAFNHRSEIISNIVSHFSFEELKNKILEIRARGMTDIRPAFKDAVEMLENRRGSKNIIMISDGEDHIYMHTYREMIREVADKEIILHTVNIGKEEFDRNMKVLSDWSGGHFFEPEQTNQFSVIFEKPEGRWPLRIRSREDFITRNINLNSEITGFNLIQPKSYGQVLISTEYNDPILIVGRYGLGRIGVLATDDGNHWSSQILRNNPQLISRLINWGIENPLRNKDNYVEISDSRLNEEVNVFVKSNEIPQYDNLIFSKIDENLYKASFEANQEGFFEILNKTYAVNYHRELEKIGMNQDYLASIISMGWETINKNQIEEIGETTLNKSLQIVKIKNEIAYIFIIIAIILFFIEIIVRRINRFRKVH